MFGCVESLALWGALSPAHPLPFRRDSGGYNRLVNACFLTELFHFFADHSL